MTVVCKSVELVRHEAAGTKYSLCCETWVDLTTLGWISKPEDIREVNHSQQKSDDRSN